MKVWFFKQNINNYQIFPEPSDKSLFWEINVEEKALDNGQLVVDPQGQPQLVTKAPNIYSTYDFTNQVWVEDPTKKQEYLADEVNKYLLDLDTTVNKLTEEKYKEYDTDLVSLLPICKEWEEKQYADPVPFRLRIRARSLKEEPVELAKRIISTSTDKEAFTADVTDYAMSLYEKLVAEDLTLEKFEELKSEAETYFKSKE